MTQYSWKIATLAILLLACCQANAQTLPVPFSADREGTPVTTGVACSFERCQGTPAYAIDDCADKETGSWTQAEENLTKEALMVASKLCSLGRYAEAEILLLKVLRRDPKNVAARKALTVICRHVGKETPVCGTSEIITPMPTYRVFMRKQENSTSCPATVAQCAPTVRMAVAKTAVCPTSTFTMETSNCAGPHLNFVAVGKAVARANCPCETKCCCAEKCNCQTQTSCSCTKTMVNQARVGCSTSACTGNCSQTTFRVVMVPQSLAKVCPFAGQKVILLGESSNIVRPVRPEVHQVFVITASNAAPRVSQPLPRYVRTTVVRPPQTIQPGRAKGFHDQGNVETEDVFVNVAESVTVGSSPKVHGTINMVSPVRSIPAFAQPAIQPVTWRSDNGMVVVPVTQSGNVIYAIRVGK